MAIEAASGKVEIVVSGQTVSADLLELKLICDSVVTAHRLDEGAALDGQCLRHMAAELEKLCPLNPPGEWTPTAAYVVWVQVQKKWAELKKNIE